MTVNNYGDWLKEFIEELNIENPILIGHSHGGRMIINYAGRGLGDVNKIVLIDSAGIKPKRGIKYYYKVYTYKMFKAFYKIMPKTKMIENIKERKLNKSGSSDYKSSPPVLKKTMSNILNEDQKKLIEKIKVPTLLIWGENDKDTPIKDAETMEKLIPDSGLVVIKGAGHYSYLSDVPMVNAVLDEFLKNDK